MKKAKLPKLTERAFQRQVTDLATLWGWWWSHHLYSLGTRAGLLDLELIHVERKLHIWRELKVPPNGLTAAQAEHIDRLRAVGADAGVWTPVDWRDIERTLIGR